MSASNSRAGHGTPSSRARKHDQASASSAASTRSYSTRSDTVFSAPASHTTAATSVNSSLWASCVKTAATSKLCRTERFALSLIESRFICLDKGDAFWKRLQAQQSPGSRDDIAFEYPELFSSLCICDPNLKGYPIYLHSDDVYLTHPRTLAVGSGRFLNIPEFTGDKRLLSSRLDSRGHPIFALELVCRIQPVENEQELLLASSMDVTDSVLRLAERLISKYEVPSLTQRFRGSTLSLDEIDWQQVAQQPTDSVSRDEIRDAFEVAVPDADPDIVEFHRFIEDIAFFHQDYTTFTRSPVGWGVTHTSSALAAKTDEVRIGVTLSDPATLGEVGKLFEQNDRFCAKLVWGKEKKPKTVYFVPMFRTKRTCWVTFILEPTLPCFWRDPEET